MEVFSLVGILGRNSGRERHEQDQGKGAPV